MNVSAGFQIRNKEELDYYLEHLYTRENDFSETPQINIQEFDFAPDVEELLPANYAELYRAVPLSSVAGNLAVAIAEDVDSYDSLKNIEFITGQHVEAFKVPGHDIDACLDKIYSTVDFVGLPIVEGRIGEGVDAQDMDDVRKHINDKPIVRVVRRMLLEAINKKASDIHIRPGEDHVDYLLRIDGNMVLRSVLAKHHLNAIISRFKILAQMDISEHRIPQDGGAKLSLAGHVVELRFSIMPTIHGESLVIRLLNSDSNLFELEQLGFEDADYELMLKSAHQSTGLVLVTGPTGSGKSTTLYAMLQEIRKNKGLNIISVEDPVEFHVDGVQQMQMNKKVGYTFAKALKNILRHDPDVIMIGEIRDEETAKIAIECALTGHLVLSTLHSVDTVSTVTRLLEMGVKAYLLKATLSMILAQRLAKLNCPHCLADDDSVIARQLSRDSELKHVQWKASRGCEVCNKTGLKGRRGIYESLRVDQAVADVIRSGVTEREICDVAAEQRAHNLASESIKLAEQGAISASEYVRLQVR